MWALPCGLLSVLLHFLFHQWTSDVDYVSDSAAGFMTTYSFVLGFLVVFRSQQAYSRWWEGGTLLQELRGEWFNAFSNLLAFSSPLPEKRHDVRKFHALLVRLFSMLYGAALQQVAPDEIDE